MLRGLSICQRSGLSADIFSLILVPVLVLVCVPVCVDVRVCVLARDSLMAVSYVLLTTVSTY